MRARFQLYSSVITIVAMPNSRGKFCEIIELTRADGSRKGWEVKINDHRSKKHPADGYGYTIYWSDGSKLSWRENR